MPDYRFLYYNYNYPDNYNHSVDCNYNSVADYNYNHSGIDYNHYSGSYTDIVDFGIVDSDKAAVLHLDLYIVVHL